MTVDTQDSYLPLLVLLMVGLIRGKVEEEGMMEMKKIILFIVCFCLLVLPVYANDTKVFGGKKLSDGIYIGLKCAYKVEKMTHSSSSEYFNATLKCLNEEMAREGYSDFFVIEKEMQSIKKEKGE